MKGFTVVKILNNKEMGIENIEFKMVVDEVYFNGSHYIPCISKIFLNDKEFLINSNGGYNFIKLCTAYTPDRNYLIDYGKDVSKIVRKQLNLNNHMRLRISKDYYDEINDNINCLIDEVRLKHDEEVSKADKDSFITIYRHMGKLIVTQGDIGYKSNKLNKLLDSLNPYSTYFENIADEKYIVYEAYSGDYLKIPFSEIDKVIEKVENIIKKQNKDLIDGKINEEYILKKLREKAIETETDQFIRKWVEDCNDPGESCDIDIVEEFMCPDGKIRQKRHHTW